MDYIHKGKFKKKYKKKANIRVQSNTADFNNIKSSFILKKIFNNLYKKKVFDLIKYNKKIQQRLNISINDFKNYNELIEI